MIIKDSDYSHRCSSCRIPDQDHLHASYKSVQYVPAESPTNIPACLDVPKDERSKDHGSNRPDQSFRDVASNEVW